jgi:hypothetical protein
MSPSDAATPGRARCASACVLALVAAACGEPAEPPAPRGVGTIRVATVVDLLGPEADLTTIDAHFEHAGTRTVCKVSEHGACVVYDDCVSDPDRTRPEAGELGVDTADGRFTQKLSPDANGAYTFGDEADIFSAGDTITASFAGGDVPAFDLAGVFPAPLVLSEPVVPTDGSDLVVARATDLTFRWTGGSAGTVFSVSQDTLSPALLRCAVPSESGVLTVPASALAELDGGRLDLRTVTSVTAGAGGYDVRLVLAAAGVDSAGNGLRVSLEP